jgi:negative regulator of sigma E activity
MSEHIHEQISAFLDDELSSEESAFLVRRLASDALAHRQTVRYTTIGSVLREEAVLANSAVLRERIQAVLDGVPVSQDRSRPPSHRQARWARLIAGVGVAASVAIVAILGLRVLNDPAAPAVRSATVAPEIWSEPDSYVVPGETTQSPRVITPPIWMTNYLVQHGHYASTLNRTSVHSNVIGRREPERSSDAEQAQDEVRAR